MTLRGAPDLVDHGTLDNQGAIWLFTPTELLRWKDGQLARIPPPREVVARRLPFAVEASTGDHSGRLWVSVGGSGVFYREGQTWTFVPVLPGRPDWAAIAVDADTDDRVWLGYRDEVARVYNGEVRIYSQPQGLSVGPLQALRTRGRQVWVGGELGLALLHGDQFHTVQVADGADFGSVSDIVPTEDGIWLTAAKGIVHIPGTEVEQLAGNPGHQVRYEVFDLESDLPEALSAFRERIRAIEGRDGVLWFLTHEGIATIDPRHVPRRPPAPLVIVRRVTADDRDYPPHQGLSLPPLTRTLHIQYTAPSLAIPGWVRFRHRLDGWDDQWHDAGSRREVFYTDLRPGRYTLRIATSNSNGVWNEAGTTLPFTIAPAWFQTAWFQAFVALALVAGIIVAYRARVRRVAATLSARFEERLAERTRIARELHDTLLQTVQGSRIFAQLALASDDPQQLRQGMAQLTDLLGRAVKEGRGAVQTLRDSVDASHDLAEALGTAAENLGRPPEVTVSVAVQGTARELHPMVRDEIYRIGYEAIRNVYAHAGATQLDIVLDYGHDLTLRIADNGLGIDPAIADAGKSGHYGVHGMRERAKSIGAPLTITGGSTGTTLLLVVPGRSAFGGHFASPPSPQR
jgi:signal transduction histidine kinase